VKKKVALLVLAIAAAAALVKHRLRRESAPEVSASA